MSPGTSVSSARATVSWSAPTRKAWPMCETSNRPACGAHMIVLGDDAVGILHRHVVAGERHHAGAARDMQRVQRGLAAAARRGAGGGIAGATRRLGGCDAAGAGALRLGWLGCFGRLGHDRFRIRTRPGNLPGRAPSVAEPERFRRATLPAKRCRAAGATYSVGEPSPCGAAAFQSFIPLRSVCLSVSGAVAPSAPAVACVGPVSPAGFV